MAKANWLTVNPMSGTGNSTLSNKGTVHTGRIKRNTTVTAVVEGLEAAKSYQVEQFPNNEFITVTQSTFDVSQEQNTLVITGTSNSPILSFIASGSLIVEVPDLYKIGQADVSNGFEIDGDPGATAQFNFEITIIVPKNTVGARSGKLTIIGSTSEINKVVTINQAISTRVITYTQGEYIKSLSRTSQTVNYGGTASCVATLLDNTAQYTYTFDGWYEGNSKVTDNLSLTVSNITANRTFTTIAKRTLNKYTLSFTITPAGGGTVTGAGTYDYGTNVTSLAVPADGYHFVKWVSDTTGTEYTENPFTTGWTINQNRKPTCVFDLNVYFISCTPLYRVNESGGYFGGTTGGTATADSMTYRHGDPVTLKATPAVGYRFEGWYMSNVLVSSSTTYSFTATGAASFEGRFQKLWYDITYTAGTGGSVSPTSQRVQHGGTASSTATVTAGYTFAGWYQGSTKVSSSLTLSVTNITANANYLASFGINIYEVNYEAGEGIASVSLSSVPVEHGATATASTATLKIGYDFDGWYDGTTRVSTALTYAPTNVTSNKTYVAKGIIKKFVITGTAQYRDTDSTGSFITGTNGGSVTGSGTYDYGTTALLTATAVTGYNFVGWFDTGGTQLTGDGNNISIYSDKATTVYARFQKKWLTITYTKGVGVNALSKTSERAAWGSTVTSETAVAITGYNTPTWTKDSGAATLTVESGKATLTNIQSDCVITASATINVYSVHYTKNTNIASLSRSSENVYHGGNASCVATLLSTTVQYTYTFQGWYEGSTQISTNLSLTVSNITSARVFEARGAATLRQYTITATITPAGGGTVAGTGTYNYGSYVVLRETPSDGYQFVKWISEDGTEYTTVQQWLIDKNRSITCVFERLSYTVTYNKGTGVNTISRASETVYWGNNALGCTATVLTGYTFDGWYQGSTKVSSALTFAPQSVKAAATYEARATINTYTVNPEVYYRVTNGTGNYKPVSDLNSFEDGIMKHTDPYFSSGVNGTYRYNNSGGTTTTWTRIAAPADAPAENTHIMRYSYDGTASTTSPGFGGFTFLTPSYANAVFYTKIIAKIPIGKTIVFASNATGTGGGSWKWITSVNGTGAYATYIFRLICGSSGEFSTTNFFYINGGSGAFDFDVAYATVFDVTHLYPFGGTVTGAGTYNHGTSPVVTATPLDGFKFDGWYTAGASGGTLLSSSASYTISNIVANTTVYARFTRKYFNVNYLAGSYISSVSRASEVVGYGVDGLGSLATIMATTAQYSYAIDGWYQGSTRVSIVTNYVPKKVTSDLTVEARATRTLRSYTVTYVAGDYISSISRASETVNYGANAAGSTATIMATTAQYSYAFDGWYDGTTRVSTALTYAPTNIQGAKTYTAKAIRTLRSYTVSVSGDPSTRVTVSGGGTYNYGASVTVTCTKNANDVFDGWYEGANRVSTSLSYTFTLSAARTLVAKVLYLDVTPTSLSFAGKDNAKTFSVQTNVSWTIE